MRNIEFMLLRAYESLNIDYNNWQFEILIKVIGIFTVEFTYSALS